MDVAIANENGLVEQGREVDRVEGRGFLGHQIVVEDGLRGYALLVLLGGGEDAAHRLLVLGYHLMLEKLQQGPLLVEVTIGGVPPVFQLLLEAIFFVDEMFFILRLLQIKFSLDGAKGSEVFELALNPQVLDDAVLATETLVDVAHHVGLELEQKGVEDALGDLMIDKLELYILSRDLQIVDKLVKSNAPVNDLLLDLQNVAVKLLPQRRILEVRIPRQRNTNSQFLARVLDVFFASDCEGVHDILVHQEVLLVDSAFFVGCLLSDRLSLVDGLLEVLTKEHEHVVWPITLLRNINHKNNILLVQIILVFGAILSMTLSVKGVQQHVRPIFDFIGCVVALHCLQVDKFFLQFSVFLFFLFGIHVMHLLNMVSYLLLKIIIYILRK